MLKGAHTRTLFTLHLYCMLIFSIIFRVLEASLVENDAQTLITKDSVKSFYNNSDLQWNPDLNSEKNPIEIHTLFLLPIIHNQEKHYAFSGSVINRNNAIVIVNRNNQITNNFQITNSNIRTRNVFHSKRKKRELPLPDSKDSIIPETSNSHRILKRKSHKKGKKLKHTTTTTEAETTEASEDETSEATVVSSESSSTDPTTSDENVSTTEDDKSDLTDTEFRRKVLTDPDAMFADHLIANEGDREDAVVTYGSQCDHTDYKTCWFEREVGDTLTLDVNISSYKDRSSFVVRWIRLYHRFSKKKGIAIKIEPDRLPWNMVWGSGGRELRLNPVTNTDMDPNSITAKVFLVREKNERKLYQPIKELAFRIDIPPIDMGKVYTGEELNINLENFLTLPEGGALLADWKLEQSPGQLEPMPSNFKLSPSGRSVVIKEFNKSQKGLVTCVVYSPFGIAVAKRKFSILKVVSKNKKRSLLHLKQQERRSAAYKHQKAFHRCLREDENSRLDLMAKLLEYSRPISRKKRYRKKYDVPYIGDCVRSHARHSRWIPSLFDDQGTTLDSRVMSVQRLVELSEESDGTLDDVIPHEVHFVEPDVQVVKDHFLTYLKVPDFQPNCSTDDDCGSGAICVTPNGQDGSGLINEVGHKGYCYCRPEYFGNGFQCTPIPRGVSRDKRIRRAARDPEDVKIAHDLFYSSKLNTPPPDDTEKEPKEAMVDAVGREQARKSLEYEEEDASLLGSCRNRKDCNHHAFCYQDESGHPYCKCLPGFRGNGIFCWEIVDYVPMPNPGSILAPEAD